MARQPNILLITSDQQHYDTLGVTNSRIQTPALDRLAREGVRFNRAYCNNPTCTPSRATMITGMYPSWHGAWSLGTKLFEDVPTVGDILQRGGYQTSLIGKAHFQPLASRPGMESIECHPKLRDLAFWDQFRGPWYGFQRVETARMHGDEHLVGQHYAIWMERKGLKNWADYFRAVPPADSPRRYGAWDLPQEFHYTTWTAEQTIESIRRHVDAQQPFLCWSSFHDPHPPYVVPQPWAGMYNPDDMQPGRFIPGEFDDKPPHFAMTHDRDADWSAYRETPQDNHGYHYQRQEQDKLRRDMAFYYGMTSFMDQQIGRILDELDRLGIAEQTIVVFTSDHGHFLGHHGLTAKAGWLYEDLLRVPFLVRWPGRVPAGQVSESLQALIDLPCTFLHAAGLDVPGAMQGVTQLDVWCGRQQQARDHVICEHRHQPTAVQMRSFITPRHKMTVYRDQPYGELYDLHEDPMEVKNHWADSQFAGVKAQLMEQFVNAEMCREPMRMPRIASA